MRQVYNRRFTATFSSGGSTYVFAEKIQPGYVLRVHSCFAYSPQRDANDNIIIGVRNGGEDVLVAADAPLAARKGISTPTDFFVGEGDQVFASFPEAENEDSLGIHLNGVLLTLKEWEHRAE